MSNLETMSLALRLEKMYGSLPPREKRVAKFVMWHPEKVLTLSVTALGKETDTSDATVVRFCQRLGYEGYREFRVRVARELRTAGPTPTVPDEHEHSELANVPRHAALAAVERTSMELDHAALQRVATAIATARRVDFYGAGASAVAAMDAHMKFMRLGIVGMAHMNAHMQVMSAAVTSPEDVAIGISHSGCTRDTLDALAHAKASGATTVAVTGFSEMPIESLADIVLYTKVAEEHGRTSFAATVAQLTLFDILFLAVTRKLGDDAVVNMEKTRGALVHKIFGPPSSA